jgi:hypothetical protein
MKCVLSSVLAVAALLHGTNAQDCTADTDDSGEVDVTDLLALLGQYGAS